MLVLQASVAEWSIAKCGILRYDYYMPARWNRAEEKRHRSQLLHLYVTRNLSLNEVSKRLRVSPGTVYDRLKRLAIPTQPERKSKYLNRRSDIILPKKESATLAEFLGVMLGDGHVSHFQATVHLGTKEAPYAQYIRNLFRAVCGVPGRIAIRNGDYRDVYIGSTMFTRWLRQQGLVANKVNNQVNVPNWILRRPTFIKPFLRGMFDTDGGIYLLRNGIQIAFTNRSLPLLRSLHTMLCSLGYTPSKVSGWKIYLTRRKDIERFFYEIRPQNPKHVRRFRQFISMRRSYSGNYSRL